MLDNWLSSKDLVKQELVEDKSEELKEPTSISLNEQFLDDIELKTEVEDKSDSLSETHMEFLTDSEEQPSESLGANHESEIDEKVDHFQPKESDSNEVEDKYFQSANEDSESEIEETVYTPPVINLETDSESGDKEFISIKDNESPVLEIEGGTEKSQTSGDLYQADVGEYASTAPPEVDETTSQTIGVPSLEDPIHWILLR